MDGVFDHEDPNNRLEEIPLDYMDDDEYDDDDEYFDAHGKTSFMTGGEMVNENILEYDTDENFDSWELRRKKLLWDTKIEIVRSAISDVTGKHWDAKVDSLNT